MRICPSCRTEYLGREVFCPVDAARLVSTEGANFSVVDPDDPIVGTILAGRYEIVKRIGEGGMGLVYEGLHKDIDKRVAVKVLRDDLSNRPDVLERFKQEAKSASRIGHKNIVDVFDFGETVYGASYIVMEFLDGEDLANLLSRDAVVDLNRAADIVTQCCAALGAAHDKHIVHRDMKPENIFLTKGDDFRDFVKIVDFGIAKMSDIETEGAPGRKLTKTGMIFGTPEYMSPEQAAGKAFDHRVDVYALGVILYECLAGRVPFVGDSFMGILTQHLFETPPVISEVNPSAYTTVEMNHVIDRALAKDPDDRYQTMAELAEAIDYAVQGKLSKATREGLATGRSVVPADTVRMSSPPSFNAPPKKSKGPLLVALILGAAVALAFLFFRPGDDVPMTAPSSPGQIKTVATAEGAEENPEDVLVELSPNVRIYVITDPQGAQVRVDGTEGGCGPTPCDLEVRRDEEVVLVAEHGDLVGRTRVQPIGPTTVQMTLGRMGVGENERAKRQAGSRQKSAAAKERPRPKRPARTGDLKVPDIFR